MADNDKEPTPPEEDTKSGKKDWYWLCIVICSVAIMAVLSRSSAWGINQEQLLLWLPVAIVVTVALSIIAMVARWVLEIDTNKSDKSIDIKGWCRLFITICIVAIAAAVVLISVWDMNQEQLLLWGLVSVVVIAAWAVPPKAGIKLGETGRYRVRITICAVAITAGWVISKILEINQEDLHFWWPVAIVVIVSLAIIFLVSVWNWEMDTNVSHQIIDIKAKASLGVIAAVLSFIIGGGGIIVTYTQLEIQGYQAAMAENDDAEIFAEAVKQVANQDIATRLGGLISLGSLSYENKDQYKRVWRHLGHFLRTPPELDDVDENKKIGKRQDIQHIIDMLKDDRSKETKTFRLPLYEANLEGADLRGTYLQNADLRDANLEGTDLRGAYLQGAELSAANLLGADLNMANLLGADLNMANLENTKLQDAKLKDANLQEANLYKAMLQGTGLENTNLRRSNLREAELQGANLEDADLQEANLEDANLQEANLEGADLKGAYLSGAKLQGANLRGAGLENAYLRGAPNLENAYLQGADLSRANLLGAKLSEANLEDAMLQVADLREAELLGANLKDADLNWANLEGANLQKANLEGAYLIWVNLGSANLQEANLLGANLQGADLREADLQGANLEDADLRGTLFGGQGDKPQDLQLLCENHTNEQLQQSYIEGSPENVSIPADCGLTKTITYNKWTECKDPWGLLKELSLSEGLPEGLSEELSEGLSEGLAEGLAEALAEILSEGLSEELSEELSEGLSEELSEELSGEVSERLSEGLSEGLSEELLESMLECMESKAN